MINTLKTLLLKMAQLPLKDQNWILNQLTSHQQKQFVQYQGIILLDKARKFRMVSHKQLPLPAQVSLPELGHELMQYDPLYIAIILEQGQFIWTTQFLETYAQSDLLKKNLDYDVTLIKPATKAYVFQQWNNQYCFDDQLDYFHG